MHSASIHVLNFSCLVDTKPLSEPMLEYCEFELRIELQSNLKQSVYIFIEENAFENYILSSAKWHQIYFGLNVFRHDDAIKWKHFPRNWPFVRGIHRGPVNSPHKGQWRGAFMFSLICAWINDWVNNRGAGDLRRHRVHYDVIVMVINKVMLERCWWRD